MYVDIYTDNMGWGILTVKHALIVPLSLNSGYKRCCKGNRFGNAGEPQVLKGTFIKTVKVVHN